MIVRVIGIVRDNGYVCNKAYGLGVQSDVLGCYNLYCLNDKYSECVNCSIVMTRVRARLSTYNMTSLYQRLR